MAISGLLLGVLTMQLFGVLGLDISEFYFKNVVLFGASSLGDCGDISGVKKLETCQGYRPIHIQNFQPAGSGHFDRLPGDGSSGLEKILSWTGIF